MNTPARNHLAIGVPTLLTGCGRHDGTNPLVASSIFVHMSRLKIPFQCYAPQRNLTEVFNHFKNKTELQPPYRCALIESARIARGNVLPLHKLRSNVCHHKALIIPDGQGSIKTTLDFDEGKTIIPEVEYVLKEFINARKPIGFMGISALLAPFVAKHPTITLGKNDDQCKWPFRHFIPIAEKLGANVLLMEQNEICHDNKNLMYSTPSTLYSAPNGNVVDIHDACCSFVACMYQIADVCNKNNSIKNCTQ
ncbi:glutamine amidotransferase-like class 1 domain-containing protein 3, mitochondrial [Adelges cooleyi]|uniref:glutamine amidotransferase-like class 1 domain-containing protein 3, mitochondrial n=1 Tax=Adelges cooleyi TaxID=133065 RepID=UPI002180405C|nr:glutamine amidotransferase-like class 1 domain-containing protein 3, mitochondrial [Adelges cooleyi]